MKSYCEWFLSNGTVLYGKEAKAHLHSILSNYENLIDHIHFVLKDCLDHCRISRENTLPNTVMFTGESLNIIQIQLELLLAEICDMTRSSAEKMIVMLVSKKEKLLAMCQNSLLPGQLKERLTSLIEERARILEGETAILKIVHS